MARQSVISIKALWTPNEVTVTNMFPAVPVTIGKVGKISIEAMLPFEPDDLDGYAKVQALAQDFKRQLIDGGTIHRFTQEITTTGQVVHPLFTAGDDDDGSE